MRVRTAPSMAMIAIAFLIASALALALTMVGSAQERGISSVRAADAAARVGVTAKCDGNPEKVIVKNNTRHRIKIKKVGSIYRPYDYEPKIFNKILGRGKTATFESGPAANHNVISKQYIFNSDVGSREGARVATSIGRYVDRCN
jgi:hypothetical protein